MPERFIVDGDKCSIWKDYDEWPPDTRKENEDGVKLAIEKEKRIQ